MNLRMTYGIGYNDLMEPAYGFTYKDQWVHICIVTDEEGVDGESENGIPIMLKMYLNGEVVLKKHQNTIQTKIILQTIYLFLW